MNTYKRNRRHSRRRDLRRWLAGASRGQAIVLLAVIMVVLIGFTGLAIDGGQLYFLRRDAQNAVDAAVLSAVYALCAEKTHDEVVADAQAAALDNGFNDAADDVSVTVTTPYDWENNGLDSSDDDYVQVIINASKPPKLIQLVYQGPLEVTVSGVGHCRPTREFTEVGAMFVGGTGCGEIACSFTGSHVVIDGGIHSNSGMKLNGNTSDLSDVYGDVSIVGTYSNTGIVYHDGSPTTGVEPVPMPEIWSIADFRPGGKWAQIANDNGQYVAILGDDLDDIDAYVTDDVMDPGIYYTDQDIKLNSSDLNDVNAAGVTWVAEGEISLGPDDDTVLSPYSAVGLPPMPLAFANNNGVAPDCLVNKGITISASGVEFTGVLYAPNGLISFSVSSGTTMDGALVGWIVDLSAADFELHYNPDLFPPIPPSGSLVE